MAHKWRSRVTWGSGCTICASRRAVLTWNVPTPSSAAPAPKLDVGGAGPSLPQPDLASGSAAGRAGAAGGRRSWGIGDSRASDEVGVPARAAEGNGAGMLLGMFWAVFREMAVCDTALCPAAKDAWLLWQYKARTHNPGMRQPTCMRGMLHGKLQELCVAAKASCCSVTWGSRTATPPGSCSCCSGPPASQTPRLQGLRWRLRSLQDP